MKVIRYECFGGDAAHRFSDQIEREVIPLLESHAAFSHVEFQSGLGVFFDKPVVVVGGIIKHASIECDEMLLAGD